MKKLYILPLIAASLLATGCSQDNPFNPNGGDMAEGQLLRSALSMDLKDDAMIRGTRADISADDFNIVISLKGHSEPAAKYLYAEMPEVVTLPAGTYTVTATYGENRSAAWESPYYLGKSEEFEIVANEINSYINPIECRLENVMVSVEFDSDLRAHMSSESYVEVKVGDNEGMNFTTTEADAKRPCYFKHIGECTLVATFHGQIDGVECTETKTLQNVEKGNHYRLTFKRHSYNPDGSGDIEGEVNVDATVTVTNVERNVELAEDQPLDDNERPKEGEGNDPVTPPDPPVADAGPTVTGEGAIDLDGVNDLNSITQCILKIHTDAEGGITGFTVDIDSPGLTEDALSEFGLSTHLDLVNPTNADMADGLAGLQLPYGDDVRGKSDVTFDISGFLLPLKGVSPAGESMNTFTLKVTDANGTTTKVLKLKYVKE